MASTREASPRLPNHHHAAAWRSASCRGTRAPTANSRNQCSAGSADEVCDPRRCSHPRSTAIEVSPAVNPGTNRTGGHPPAPGMQGGITDRARELEPVAKLAPQRWIRSSSTGAGSNLRRAFGFMLCRLCKRAGRCGARRFDLLQFDHVAVGITTIGCPTPVRQLVAGSGRSSRPTAAHTPVGSTTSKQRCGSRSTRRGAGAPYAGRGEVLEELKVRDTLAKHDAARRATGSAVTRSATTLSCHV
jgi:hypothetical protein